MKRLWGVNFSRQVKLGGGGGGGEEEEADSIVALQLILGISISTADFNLEKWTKIRVQTSIGDLLSWNVMEI